MHPVPCIVPRIVALLVVMAQAAPAAAQDVRSRDDAPAAARYLPPAQHRPGAYVLGIQARNTPAGVDVVSVQPGSVAQRSGLEAGDVIVTVSGFQVGFVGDRLFDVGDEIARRIDAAGRVALLVRNRRTGGLVTVPVQFAGQTAAPGLTVRLLARDRVRLPRTALATVRVLDVTQPQWRDVAVVQGQLPVTGELPVTYRLELPPLAARHRYAVDARIDDGGRLLLRAPAPVPLAALDRDTQADVVLAAAGTVGPAPSLAPRDQIQRWIEAYLGRPPRIFETEVWLAELARGRSLTNVQAGILSSSELFERQGRNRDRYLAEVHRLLTGSPPNTVQLADLRSRYDRALGVRLTFVEGLLQQPR